MTVLTDQQNNYEKCQQFNQLLNLKGKSGIREKKHLIFVLIDLKEFYSSKLLPLNIAIILDPLSPNHLISHKTQSEDVGVYCDIGLDGKAIS